MKNSQQNLLIVLALGLCGLCAWQWYVQTVQRNHLDELNRIANEKTAHIQEYTNSIQTMQYQIGQMDAHISELKDTVKSNLEVIVGQRQELNRLETDNLALTNNIAEYKQAVDTLNGRLKEAYDGVKKQNDAIQQLVTQRDGFVKKYNDMVTERNNVVSNYNDLAARFEKLKSGAEK